jgi:23S rRNA pseudouridine2457 synthase
MAIGRLDEDSEGLLLLTTDGMMSDSVKKVDKEYFVQVDGVINQQAIDQIKG